jgi:uncharacterized membrane protein
MQTASLSSSSRIQSIDMLRGLVIIIMGLDHMRDFLAPTLFAPEDVTQTTPAWFLTRWITHFCAPIFVFLAGTSAFLYGQKVGLPALRKFLWSRGVWLIFVELIIVHFAWTFDYTFWFVQVIWVIGVSMIILAFLTYLPRTVLIVLTVITILGHNLLDGVQIDSVWWYFLHQQNWGIPLGNTFLAVVYPLIPWPAVMLLGYLLATLFYEKEAERNKKLMLFGSSTLVAFILVRLINMYGDMHAWAPSDRGGIYTFLDFLNVTKYPPSLLFLMMTLGPALILLTRMDRWGQKIQSFLLTFGRVPFFYYIVHLFVGHLLGILYFGIAYGYWGILLFANPETWPKDYTASLLIVYAGWILMTVILYFMCRWFASVKKNNEQWWMRYL